jgi:signal transduction histidine kinase
MRYFSLVLTNILKSVIHNQRRPVETLIRVAWLMPGVVAFLSGLAIARARGAPTGSEPPLAAFTNASEIHRLCARPQNVLCALRFEGVVLWASPGRDQLVVQADTACVQIEMDPRTRPALQVGQRIAVAGNAVAGNGRLRETLLDNDGLHPALEQTETIWLPAGRHPIQVAWFNGPAELELSLEYAGPGITRQRIPDGVLFRRDEQVPGGSGDWVQGLEYSSYEGRWARLPDFSGVPVVKRGTTANFDLGVRTRDQWVYLRFDGYLEAPQAGDYTFWLRSDDGSRLSVGGAGLDIRVLSAGSLPVPQRISPGELAEDYLWAEAEGQVVATRRCPSGGAEVELAIGTNQACVEVANAAGPAPGIASRIRARGAYRTTRLPGTPGVAGRLLVQNWGQVDVVAPPPTLASRRVFKVSELRRSAADGQPNVQSLRLEGLVLAAGQPGWVVLQDDTGAMLVETGLSGPPLRAGQMVALTGMGVVDGLHVRLRHPPLVDNDGVHTLNERSGKVFLSAGKHPFHLSWFNRNGDSGLQLSYAGPDLPRQKVPQTALFHGEAGMGDDIQLAPGVTYRCYEGAWPRVPDPWLLTPAKEGIATGLDPALASRPTEVGLEFSGFLEVPRDGLYTFWLLSDDGGVLSLGEEWPHFELLGGQPMPSPARLAPCQPLREDQEAQWSSVEGTVTFAHLDAGVLELDLNGSTGTMRVEVPDPAGCSPLLLMNSRIRATGLPRITYTADGQRVAGALLTPGLQQVEFLEMAAAHWNDYPVTPLRHWLGTNYASSAGIVVHVRGKLRPSAAGETMDLEDETTRMRFETTQPPPEADGTDVDVLGQIAGPADNLVLQSGCYRTLAPKDKPGTNTLPRLTSIEQVKGLSREEAGRGYPAQVRGVITTPLFGGFFLQDATWAIYVQWPDSTNLTLHPGDYWEVEGVTWAEFAPNIRATRAVYLGPGTLPEPLRPTWDQLINGSLDTRYVEIQGIVTGVEAQTMTLLTRAGKLIVQLDGIGAEALRGYRDALIRVRGCIIPARNFSTQEVELGRVRLSNPAVTVDQPAPADPFALPVKHTADLLQFDSRAGAIQRVRVAGQVIHRRGSEYFLVEGTNGLHFQPRAPLALETGDEVEVVGFPELGGPSPVLREAIARRTAFAALPPPRDLAPDRLLDRSFDATRVRLEGRVTGVNYDGIEQVLELQTGTRAFKARLDGVRAWRRDLLPGSRVRLTGVYAGLGGDLASGREIDAFELLLNGPRDIQILQRPSWWTAAHTLSVMGVMVLIILASLVWISQLRRKVEERSRQLAVAIRRQEQAEAQRGIEMERARVARDLHDDLGAALTEIGLLGGLAQRANAAPERVRDHLGHITDKAREMVTSLDEIVWSLNPRHDSLASLSKYFCEYAQQLLQLTTVRCRLEVPDILPDRPLTADQRHHLLLAFKEALTNVVRHAGANEARIGIGVEDGLLVVTVADDGRGWDKAARTAGADGLENLARRLEELGGGCQIFSQPGQGTRVRMVLPLANPTALRSAQT